MQDLGSGKTAERPVRLGGALVTIVEPHRGHEVAYNRWYERDHFYAGCMIGAWNISGARFVATRDLKALRYPATSPVIPDPATGSYLALYWVLAGKFGQWMQWGSEQVRWLHENDRMFEERDHVHTLMYKFRTEFEHPDGVPVELALDHRSPYVVVVIGEPADGTSLDDVDAWFRSRPLLGVVGAELAAIPLPSRCGEGRAGRLRREPLLPAVVRRRRSPGHLGRDVRPPRGGVRRRRARRAGARGPVPGHRPRHRHLHRRAVVTRRAPANELLAPAVLGMAALRPVGSTFVPRILAASRPDTP
jgi:hypothetical protein